MAVSRGRGGHALRLSAMSFQVRDTRPLSQGLNSWDSGRVIKWLRVAGSRLQVAGWVALVLTLVTVSVVVTADGGLFTQSTHGNAATGVERDMTLPKGSCAQCHTGHGSNPGDFGLWTANDNSLCFTCHGGSLRSYPGQTLYSSSGHAVSASSLNGRSVGRCVQCHNPHGTGDQQVIFPHLTARLEEETCYTCHGTGFRPTGAADIQSQVNNVYSHRVADTQRKHDDLAESGSAIVNPNPSLSGMNRHVECSDCHNPHYSGATPRQTGSSRISEMLLGSWGVRPVYSAAAWTAPASYVVERFQNTSMEYEYYLCLKCHSAWAWGNAAPYTRDGIAQTDQALEFNPANPAYHNVTGQASSVVPSEDVVYGTTNPPAYVSPWGPNSEMACTDCHASDAGTGNVRSPHGSTFPFMLKKRFKAQVGAMDNTGMSGTQADICFDCHDWNTYGQGGSGGSNTNFRHGSENLHRKSDHARRGCFQCHSAVPHGFNRKHMIVYVTDGPPYFAAGADGILNYTHPSSGSYSESNCSTTAGCHGD